MMSSRANHLRNGPVRARVGAVAAIAFAVWALMAAGALAARPVNIVRQGPPPVGPIPANTHYFTTIQAAVDASTPNSWVLIEPGLYHEEVLVDSAHHGIHIRGMDRNTVILDGEHEPAPNGSNGILVSKANNVWIENLTARNFDRATPDGENGNEIWWTGGDESGRVGAHGWYGSYLTAYDDGLNGGYGIFTNNEKIGSWENIYASGFNDSGIYLGACQECKARISKATIEYNAVGYSGSNSGGQLVIEKSTFRHNSAGIVPNSENPGDGPPPQDGECNRKNKPRPNPTPTIASTNIERCTVLKENLVTENNDLEVPANESTAAAPWGVGVELPGDYADLVENNTITNNANNGVLGFEYPNPFPPQEDTIDFALAGNRISDNTFSNNGSSNAAFAGDVTLAGGIFTESTNNCLSGNSFADATFPGEIETTWGCQNATTPSPFLNFAAVEYLLQLQTESQARLAVDQAPPPAQTTMPNPCEGVPRDPLCP
jgi:hypothetical protein